MNNIQDDAHDQNDLSYNQIIIKKVRYLMINYRDDHVGIKRSELANRSLISIAHIDISHLSQNST